MKKYTVRKRFVFGILAGLTIEEETDVEFQQGKQYGFYIADMVKLNSEDREPSRSFS